MGVSKGPKNKILIIPEENALYKQILKQWVNGNQRQKFQTIPEKLLFKNGTSLNETVRESPMNKIQTIPGEDFLLKRILKYWINENQRQSFQLSPRRCSQQRHLIEIGNTVVSKEPKTKIQTIPEEGWENGRLRRINEDKPDHQTLYTNTKWSSRNGSRNCSSSPSDRITKTNASLLRLTVWPRSCVMRRDLENRVCVSQASVIHGELTLQLPWPWARLRRTGVIAGFECQVRRSVKIISLRFDIEITIPITSSGMASRAKRWELYE